MYIFVYIFDFNKQFEKTKNNKKVILHFFSQIKLSTITVLHFLQYQLYSLKF